MLSDPSGCGKSFNDYVEDLAAFWRQEVSRGRGVSVISLGALNKGGAIALFLQHRVRGLRHMCAHRADVYWYY